MPTPAPVSALLRRTPTVARLPNRALIAISGTQASEFLNGILATSIPNPPRPFYSTFLHAQGRVLYDVFVHTPPVSSDPSTKQPTFLIEYDPSVPSRNSDAPSLLTLLKRYVLRAKVRLRDATAEHDIWAAWGSEREDKAEVPRWEWAGSGAGEQVWGRSSWPWGEGEHGLLKDRRAIGMGVRRLVKKGDRPQECSTHDGGSEEDYLLHRIAHGVAEGATDIPPLNAFPMESNLDIMGGLDFRKGCYVGQELTVRTYHTGVVRKRIYPVVIHSSSSYVQFPIFTADGPLSMNTHTPQTPIRASPTHSPGEGRVPRPRGTGALLSNTQGVGLALLRLEHVDKVQTGDLKLELASAEGEPLRVTPWRSEYWPVPEPSKEEDP
ncbi:Aminomethyltransferase folate-binding domain-containing protein [Amylostereum chailletii]|nr:Aminomethyltransferase folate-binding domain-containing protein [Amylostereum chailletii]